MALRWLVPILCFVAFAALSCGGASEDEAASGTNGGSAGGSSSGGPASGDDPSASGSDGSDPVGSEDTPGAIGTSTAEAEAEAAAASPTPTRTPTPTPTRTPTPAPTQTPTATPIPTAVTVTVSGGCEFSPENAIVVRGGTVTFVNAAGHELEITIFPPGEDGDTLGQGIEPGEASAALPIEERGVSKAVCEGPEDGEFGNMRITAVL